jgi:hypothetical protein
MARRAVAATLVAAIIFTSLLVANLTVYSAANNHLTAVDLTAQEERELAYASVLTGISAYSSLSLVQDRLVSSPIGCSSPQAYLASLAGDMSLNGTSQGVRYSVSSSWNYVGVRPTGAANASIVRPFGGYVPGDLNLLVTVSLNETYDGALPSYSSQTTYTVHLPVAIGLMLSECSAALAALNATFSGLSSCDSAAVASAIGEVQSAYDIPPTMTLGGSAHMVDETGACNVEYWVTMTEVGVEGVSGTFDWTLSGSGSVPGPRAP